jgi:uncharacterized protein YcnI/copper(I)-binding protein
MKTIQTTGYAVLIASVSAIPALAHTSFVNGTAAQESTIVAALQVPHGCEGGLATTEVRMILPEGFIAAKPQPKAGWELEIIKGDYQKSYKNHGSEVKSGPTEIRWKNGNLPDDFYDTFNVQGKVSGVEAGTELPFRVTQLCGDKGKASWDQVAAAGVDPHSLDNPAPVIRITAKAEAAGEGHMHHDMAAMPSASHDVVKVGNLELSGASTKAMLPGQPVGGGFVTITNHGDTDDRLVAAESSNAGRVELHEMAIVSDVMKMRKLDDGIVIPAGQTVELTPGGLHFMFFNVKKPFAEGDTVPVTLTFEKAGKAEIVLPVGKANGGEHKHN